MGRRIFVGDVQGCRVELERLLERVGFDPAADELHPVGDFVNRGPDSLGTLRLARSAGAGGVLGNHDLHALRVSRGEASLRPRDTLDGLLAAEDRDELLAWLAARPFLRVWPDLYLVHAGLSPRWSDPAGALAGADPWAPSPEAEFAVRVRHCNAAGERPADEGADGGFRPWYELYRPDEHGGRLVVFGHWSVRGLLLAPFLRGLDTGCVWGGRLSAWIAEEDRVVQVEAERRYSPLEG